MPHLRKALLFPFLVLTLSLFVLAGCGGDDDDDDSDDSPSGGNSQSSGSGQSSSGGSGGDADQRFVREICKSAKSFSEAMDKSISSFTPQANQDPEEAIKKVFESIAKPFEEFVKGFKNARPPKDIEQWHKDSIRQLDKVVEALKKKDYDDPALQELGDQPFPELPKAAEERLQKVADKTQECNDLGVFDE